MVKLAGLCAALLSCLSFAFATASAAPSAAHNGPHYTIRLIVANGSGCPPGSATVRQVNDTEFRISYGSFQAADGPGVSPLQNRENCLLAMQVGVPSGWTYRFVGVDYRGYAHLDRGARGVLRASYYFAGLPGTFYQSHTIYGPQNHEYAFADPPPLAWAPCHFNDTVNVDTSLEVFRGSSNSFVNSLAMGSADVGSNYHLGFRRC